MRKILPLLATWVIALLFVNNTGTDAKSLRAEVADGYQVIDLVNQVRAGYGLAPLEVNSALMTAAQGHSDYQASIGSVTHTGAGGSRPVDRAVAAGYGGGAKVFISENIYGGSNTSPQQAVDWWQGDPPHLNTMINAAYRDVGAGVATNGTAVYYTLDAGYTSGSPGSGNTPAPSNGTTPTHLPGATSGSTAVVIIPVQAATPGPDGSIFHIVQQGQALWNIAAIYKIPLPELIALNGLTQNSFIHPGEKILVRPADKGAITATVDLTSSFTGTLETDIEHPIAASTQDLAMAENPYPDSTLTLSLPGSMAEYKTPISESTLAKNTDLDLVLVGIVGLIILGITLILVGSMARRFPSS